MIARPDSDPVFGDVIHVYTAEQGVADGVLFDALELPDDAGKIVRDMFKGAPVYLTAALYRMIEKAVDHPRWCNDWRGVTWDILNMARAYGATRKAGEQARRAGIGRASFPVIITGVGRRRNHVLDAVISGDGLTFCLRGED